ncbi:hypothetical protein D9Q98_009540 [Chlorella vulgaris]|uniref:SBP-type domain-containing protein n=1 Tax=Chlorella vulgaris TaxID=3077 RepID=A0A9D4TFA6_CHLVU|nr:hypothetical protein D9Q98_009540 [Chlorella vulgaris]
MASEERPSAALKAEKDQGNAGQRLQHARRPPATPATAAGTGVQVGGDSGATVRPSGGAQLPPLQSPAAAKQQQQRRARGAADVASPSSQPRSATADVGGAGAAAAAAAAGHVQSGAQGTHQGAPAAAAAPKKKPGRQRRTSVLCQVLGCGEELVNAKGYYRRYRICPKHCSMASFQVDGREQRFCQQCGRFQDIAEFEGARKSCRRKLKRHNERRRVEYVRDSDEEGDEGEEAEVQQQQQQQAEEPEPQQVVAAAVVPPAAAPAASRRPPRSPSRGLSISSAPSVGGSKGSGSGAFDAAAAAASGAAAAAAAATASAAGLKQSLQRRGSVTAEFTPSNTPGAAAAAAGAAMQQLQEPPPLFVGGGGALKAPAAAKRRLAASAGGGQQLLGVPVVAPQLLAAAQSQHAQAQAQAQQHAAQAAQQRLQQAQQPQQAEQMLQQYMQQAARQEQYLQQQALQQRRLLQQQAQRQQQQQQVASPEPTLAGLFDIPQNCVASPFYLDLPSPFLGSTPPQHATPANQPPPRAGFGSAAGGGGSQLLQCSLTGPRASGRGNGSGSGPVLLAQRSPSLQEQLGMASLPAQQQQQQQPQPQQAAAASRPRSRAQQVGPMTGGGSGDGARGGSAGGGVGVAAAHSAPVAHQPLVPLVPPLTGPAPEDLLVRMSLKVFNCTPDQLLPLVRAELDRLLDASPAMLEGYIRPGCTHLTLSMLLPREQAQRLLARGLPLRRWLAGGTFGGLAGNRMIVQFGNRLTVLHGGRVAAVVDLRRPPADLAAAGLPRLHSLHPCCVLADQPGTVTLVGAAISGSTDLVLCRQQCRHLGSTAVDGSGAAASSSSVSASASASGGSGHSSSTQLLTQHLLSSTSVAESRKADGQAGGQELRFIAPQGVLPGCVEVEVQRGSVLSEPLPLLALPCAAAVSEVRQLAGDCTAQSGHSKHSGAELALFLRQVGLVVQFTHRCQLAAAGHTVQSYPPRLRRRLGRLARRLLAAVEPRGCAALAALLRPATAAADEGGEEAPLALPATAPLLLCPEYATAGMASCCAVEVGPGPPTQATPSALAHSQDSSGSYDAAACSWASAHTQLLAPSVGSPSSSQNGAASML